MRISCSKAMSSVGLLQFDDEGFNRLCFLVAANKSVYAITTMFNLPKGTEDFFMDGRIYFPNDDEQSALEVEIHFVDVFSAKNFFVKGPDIVAIKICQEIHNGALVPSPGIVIADNADIIAKALTSEHLRTFKTLSVGSVICFYANSTSADFITSFSKALRSGIIAGFDQTSSEVIVDAFSYEGTYGSPVFEKMDIEGGAEYKLRGILSGPVSHDQYWSSTSSIGFGTRTSISSGFSEVQSIDQVLELLVNDAISIQ